MPRARALAVRAVACALAAAAIAWACTVFGAVYVGGGSMAPALRQGDLVVMRRGGGGVREGSIVCVAKPGWPGGVLHRVVGIGLDGSLQLQGDANPVPDLAPAMPEAVRGVAVLALPTGVVGSAIVRGLRMLQSLVTSTKSEARTERRRAQLRLRSREGPGTALEGFRAAGAPAVHSISSLPERRGGSAAAA